jgi:hypothetical protein
VYPNICDPTRLTVGRGNGLETPPAHQQQVPHLRLVERLPSTQSRRRLSLLRIACGELSYTLPRRNTVGVLQIIQFEVSLDAVADPTKIDLPMPIARSFGVTGAKRRSTLCVRDTLRKEGSERIIVLTHRKYLKLHRFSRIPEGRSSSKDVTECILSLSEGSLGQALHGIDCCDFLVYA